MARDLETHISLASATQVGEWVERLSGDELAQRAACTAEIENESRSERVSATGFLATSPEAPNETAPAPNADSRRKQRHRGLAAFLAAATLAAVTVGAAILSGRNTPLRAAELRIASSVMPMPLPTEPPTPLQIRAAPIEPAGSAFPRAPGMTSAGMGLPDDVKPAPQHPPARSTAAPRASCDPPYYVDSFGHLIYKRECFR